MVFSSRCLDARSRHCRGSDTTRPPFFSPLSWRSNREWKRSTGVAKGVRFFKLHSCVAADWVLSLTAKIVWSIFASYLMWPEGRWPSHRRIALLAGCGRKSVSRAQCELVGRGWLGVVGTVGWGKPDVAWGPLALSAGIGVPHKEAPREVTGRRDRMGPVEGTEGGQGLGQSGTGSASDLLDSPRLPSTQGLCPSLLVFASWAGEELGRKLRGKELVHLNPAFVDGVPLAVAKFVAQSWLHREPPWDFGKRLMIETRRYRGEWRKIRDYCYGHRGVAPTFVQLNDLVRLASGETVLWAVGRDRVRALFEVLKPTPRGLAEALRLL